MKELFFLPRRKLWLLPLLFISLFSCSKEYSVEDINSNPLAAGNWQFSEGGTGFAGNIDSAYIDSSKQLKELHLTGTSNDGSQQFNLVLFADDFTAGIYRASAFQVTFQYGSSVPLMYDASQLVGEFTVQITSIDDEMLSGVFSGVALKGDSDVVNITEGSFKAVLNSGSDQPPSEGQLGNDNGSCTQATAHGNYTQGIPLINPANSVSVQVTVAIPGFYKIYTDTVNGVSFSGKGNFTSAGTFSVNLYGSGTPASDGGQQFTVHYGNSQCAFSITFKKGLTSPNSYLPLVSEQGNLNWWKYLLDGTTSYYTQVLPNTMVVDGNSYSVIGVGNNASDVQNDTAGIFRQDGGDYYALLDYGGLAGGQDVMRVPTIILKDDVPAGTSWNGPTVTLMISGTPTQFYLKFQITEKAVPVDLGAFSFPDVIKVTAELFTGGTDLNIGYEWWYAKNAGIIYQKSPGSEEVLQDYNVFP